MGETVSRIQKSTTCIKYEERVPPPRFQFKCRFDKDDEYCITAVYTRTKDIMRFPVPREKLKWNIPLPGYDPFNFTSAKILLKDGLAYKDPNM